MSVAGVVRTFLFLSPLAVFGCIGDIDDGELERVGEAEAAAKTSHTCDPEALSGNARKKCIKARLKEGKRLFDKERFGGNGRTCLTCHSKKTGTISVEEVAERLEDHEDGDFDPLFVHDGLDEDGVGTSRIAADATILITLDLPPWVTIAGDPTATQITVRRGVPTTMNTPSFDPVFMYDGRHSTLQDQALGAINAHAENTEAPTAHELDLIKEFQQADDRFFSSDELQDWAEGGAPPELPMGNTASEQRGREMFEDAPFDGSTRGICALCHSGPFLNQANEFNNAALGTVTPVGAKFGTIRAEVRNVLNLPEITVLVDHPSPVIGLIPFTLTDPGVLLSNPPPVSAPPLGRVGLFKTPTLWGATKTAPYFHNNAAKTLEEVAEHYQWFFGVRTNMIQLTQQDLDDMVAFMRLLDKKQHHDHDCDD